MAQSQGLLGGLFGLGAAGIMASDRRVKKDINKVGETDGGQNIYSFRYKSGGPMQLGLMAQEVEKDDPGAVVEIGGIKHVNYPRALSLGSSLRKAA
ncbi:tail fiber domain-containing protein [Erwinia amylovora]|uniref:tail fiber domain-containing protein n=1 Tax=Erwinia amylovora TaxID=552 RepID=UPI003D027388